MREFGKFILSRVARSPDVLAAAGPPEVGFLERFFRESVPGSLGSLSKATGSEGELAFSWRRSAYTRASRREGACARAPGTRVGGRREQGGEAVTVARRRRGYSAHGAARMISVPPK